MAISNPFTSPTFVSVWKRHFYQARELFTFPYFSGIKFIKISYLPLYINVGKRLTQGLSYSFNENKIPEKPANKVFLIYDIPSLQQYDDKLKRFRINKVNQYDAYLIDLKGFSSVEEYIQNRFKSKNRWQLKRALNKFENSFDVTFKVLTGNNINKEQYNELFPLFYTLLKKRYMTKREDYVFLKTKNWNFLKDLAYSLIMENRAGLFVLYADEMPVAIKLNYFSDEELILGIPVFDIDYDRFNVGHLCTLKTLNWCINNDIRIYDFSKGYYDYKRRWSNVHYNFSHHIVFDKHSIKGSLLGNTLTLFFRLKRKLRLLNVDELSHKIRFTLRTFKRSFIGNPYKITEEGGSAGIHSNSIKINIQLPEYERLRKPYNEILFKYNEQSSKVDVFQLNNDTYVIKGKSNCYSVTF